VEVEAKKVAVLGAGGGIGQPLSLLLKMNRLVTELSVYDIANVKGVAADLSHVNTPTKVHSCIFPDMHPTAALVTIKFDLCNTLLTAHLPGT
jgi:malate/lactate dehydrogenase